MDVAVSVYLAGGHVWQFVCDEADPMAVGLVSALPGATAQGPVTADGLIQVETRTGERMYLTRESLVAVSITGRPPLLPTAISAGKLQAAVSMPAPFAVVPGCFGEAQEALLLEVVSHGAIGSPRDARAVVELRGLPPSLTEPLIRSIAEARKLLAPGADEALLDVSVHIVGTGGSLPLPDGQDADILSFAVVVPAAGGAVDTVIDVYDQNAGAPDRTGLQARSVTIPAGALLALPCGVASGPLQPRLNGGEAIVVTGRLVRV